jgi:hypothetical protein
VCTVVETATSRRDSGRVGELRCNQLERVHDAVAFACKRCDAVRALEAYTANVGQGYHSWEWSRAAHHDGNENSGVFVGVDVH